MRVAIRLFHNLPVGSADIVHIHEAPSTVDAIIMTLERLEADGADIATLSSIALVAKAYPDGQHLLADPTMIGRPAPAPLTTQEAAPCVA
jgi:hypothetical protein